MGSPVDGMVEQWREQRPDIDPWPIAVVGRVMRLSRFWDAELKALLADHGLESGEFDVLSTLRRIGAPHELTASAFVKTCLVTSGAITNRIDRMEAKGLVERTRDTTDRRSVRIRLTRTGLELIDRVLPAHIANEKRLIQQLSAPDQRALVDLLTQLLEPFEK